MCRRRPRQPQHQDYLTQDHRLRRRFGTNCGSSTRTHSQTTKGGIHRHNIDLVVLVRLLPHECRKTSVRARAQYTFRHTRMPHTKRMIRASNIRSNIVIGKREIAMGERCPCRPCRGRLALHTGECTGQNFFSFFLTGLLRRTFSTKNFFAMQLQLMNCNCNHNQ